MSEIRWTDSHCHLEPGAEGREAAAAAVAAGVERMVNVGTDLASSLAAADLARTTPGVWATAGVHPHDASGGAEGIEDLLARLRPGGLAIVMANTGPQLDRHGLNRVALEIAAQGHFTAQLRHGETPGPFGLVVRAATENIIA